MDSERRTNRRWKKVKVLRSSAPVKTAGHSHSQQQMHNFDERSVYNVCTNEGEGPVASQSVPREIISGFASCDSRSAVRLRPQDGPDRQYSCRRPLPFGPEPSVCQLSGNISIEMLWAVGAYGDQVREHRMGCACGT